MQESHYHDLNHVYVLHVDKYIDKYIYCDHLHDTFVSSLYFNKYQQHIEHELNFDFDLNLDVNFDLDLKLHYYLLAFLRRQHCPRGQR